MHHFQVTVIQDSAKRVWEKMRNVKEKKEKLKYTCKHFMCEIAVMYFFVSCEYNSNLLESICIAVFDNLDDSRDLKTVEKDLAR